MYAYMYMNMGMPACMNVWTQWHAISGSARKVKARQNQVMQRFVLCFDAMRWNALWYGVIVHDVLRCVVMPCGAKCCKPIHSDPIQSTQVQCDVTSTSHAAQGNDMISCNVTRSSEARCGAVWCRVVHCGAISRNTVYRRTHHDLV